MTTTNSVVIEALGENGENESSFDIKTWDELDLAPDLLILDAKLC